MGNQWEAMLSLGLIMGYMIRLIYKPDFHSARDLVLLDVILRSVITYYFLVDLFPSHNYHT